MDKVNIVFPHDGGCWYCCTKTENMWFSMEFDTYVHESCLREALEDKTNREAQIMGREFGL
jgi:hypothetical protein